ncbi:hypothetical protein [Euzebya sp.]|uniref:hypothetical protein n=1 Tax=Euzebya sp. TaxID=1971409 RepID=UPI003514E249
MADTVREPGAERLPGPTRRHRLGLVLVVVAVLVGVVGLARSTGRATATDVLAIPAFETVRADRLANGTPVFVVHGPTPEGGEGPVLDVIQAFTPEVEGPITELVAWCAASQQFVAAHHGPLYDSRGRRLPSSTAGRDPGAAAFAERTAVDDLVHRQVEVVEGRTDPEDPIVVGAVQPLRPWQVEDRPYLQAATPSPSCRLTADPPGGRTGDEPFRRVVDHSFLAGPVDPEAAGWQITDGWLLIASDGSVTWCDEAPAAGLTPSCPSPREDVEVGFGFEPADVGGVATAIGGPLAVRFANGAVARAAVLADSSWHGSSLRGTERHRGRLVTSWTAEDPRIGLADLAALPGGGAAGCRAAFPTGGDPARTAVPVTGQTAVDVGGVDDLAALDDLAGRGAPVEVVVDAVTCTALAVVDPGR